MAIAVFVVFVAIVGCSCLLLVVSCWLLLLGLSLLPIVVFIDYCCLNWLFNVGCCCLLLHGFVV